MDSAPGPGDARAGPRCYTCGQLASTTGADIEIGESDRAHAAGDPKASNRAFTTLTLPCGRRVRWPYEFARPRSRRAVAIRPVEVTMSAANHQCGGDNRPSPRSSTTRPRRLVGIGQRRATQSPFAPRCDARAVRREVDVSTLVRGRGADIDDLKGGAVRQHRPWQRGTSPRHLRRRLTIPPTQHSNNPTDRCALRRCRSPPWWRRAQKCRAASTTGRFIAQVPPVDRLHS